MNVKLTAVVIWTVVLASAASASGYRCVVNDAVTADGGKISRTELIKTFVGKEFIVDRGNGRMLGDVFSGQGWEPKILDHGSRQQSFKAQYTAAPYVHVRLLTVQEFMPGNQKDFFMLDEDNLISGKCASLN